MSTEPESLEQTPRWHRLFRYPLLWAAACFALALPWYLAEKALELLPFLLTLAGGWLCGYTFVKFTLRMTSLRCGAIVHGAGAVVFSVALVWFISNGKSDLAFLAMPMQMVIWPLMLGLIPGVAWIWLQLISRVTSHRWTGPRPEQTARKTPEWEVDGRHTRLQFQAVPMRMRTLGLIITGVVIVAGSLAAVLLISLDVLFHIRSGRQIIIVLGLIAGLPTYLLVSAAWKKSSVACTVLWDKDCLRIESGGQRRDIALKDIDRLVWRCDSDYARLEVRAAAVEISLIVGVARMPLGVLPQLPQLRQQTRDDLAAAGLAERQVRKGGLTVLSRRPAQELGRGYGNRRADPNRSNSIG